MDWDKLRVFHAVTEANSFTRAAERLNLSQSAISRQISALEHEIGVPLFHRHARGLVLTEQGEKLYSTVHEVQIKLDSVQHALIESTEKPAGKLRVSTTIGLGTGWLANRVHEFLELYPEIELELILDNEELDLSQRAADCAIRMRMPTQTEIVQRRLFTVHFHIYAAPEYVSKHGQLDSIADLDKHRILSSGEDTPPYLTNIRWLETVGRPAGEPRKCVFQINNLMVLKNVCESGAGIAVLPDYIVEKDSKLMQLIPNVEAPSFDTYFAYPAESRSSAKIRAFRDFLISKARSWAY